jgi:hypothetical protein
MDIWLLRTLGKEANAGGFEGVAGLMLPRPPCGLAISYRLPRLARTPRARPDAWYTTWAVCDGRLPPDEGKRQATSARLARTAGKLYRMRDEAKADVFDEGPGGALPLALHPFPKQ